MCPSCAAAGVLGELLASFEGRQGLPPEGTLAGMRPAIEACFGGSPASVEAVWAACERQGGGGGGQWGADTLALLSRGSPTGQKVTLEALRRGGAAGMGLADCLRMEYRLVRCCVCGCGGGGTLCVCLWVGGRRFVLEGDG